MKKFAMFYSLFMTSLCGVIALLVGKYFGFEGAVLTLLLLIVFVLSAIRYNQ
jgi:hypothetical protein